MGIILTEDEWRVTGNEQDESIARRDETCQLRERVGQLERLNASLAAQVDRQALVVDAAIEWKKYWLAESDNDELLEAIDDYERAMAALAKGGDE